MTAVPTMLQNTDPSLRLFWHPVALVADVSSDRPLGVRLLGERWLVVRLGGHLTAMRDACPHRLVPLSAGTVVGEELQCAYHGYRFDASGRVTAIPALAPDVPIPAKACVATAHVTERFGLVWICLADEPLGDLLDDAGYTNPSNDIFVAGPFRTVVSAAILADNFLDCCHFQFLHRDTFGADDKGRPSLQVERRGWGLRQTTMQMIGGSHLEAAVEHCAVYEVAAPFSVELRLDRAEGSDYIWSFACPIDDTTTDWYMVHAYPLGGDQKQIADALAMQTAVGLEDLSILERMEHPNIPLDVRAEVHTKGDLGCLEYRRMLIDLVGLGGQI